LKGALKHKETNSPDNDNLILNFINMQKTHCVREQLYGGRYSRKREKEYCTDIQGDQKEFMHLMITVQNQEKIF
jgi:hypothetical protein